MLVIFNGNYVNISKSSSPYEQLAINIDRRL